MRGIKGFIWLFVFLIFSSLVFLVITRPKPVKYRSALKLVDQEMVEAKTRKLPHTPFHGELAPGNGWENYNRALAELRQDGSGNNNLLTSFLKRQKTSDRRKVEEFVKRHATAVEQLRAGVRRADGQYPYNWEQGRFMKLPDLFGSRQLANLGAAKARLLTEQGKTQEAIDLLTDVVVFAHDLGRNGPLLTSLTGVEASSAALDEIRELMVSGKLTQAQFVDLQKRLETLEQGLPTTSDAFSGETLAGNIALVQMGTSGFGMAQFARSPIADWRLLVSPMAVVSEAIETRNAYLERVKKTEAIPLPDAWKESRAILNESTHSRNAVVRMSMPSISRTLEAHRELLARVRLLRAGITYLVTKSVPSLDDPLGGKLRFKEENGKMKIWSFGQDGIDQKGKGDWQLGFPDIVLELPSF